MQNGFAHMDFEEYDLLFDQQYHGRNLKIEEGGRLAQKIKKGAKEALVVTNRPMATNELFEVEVGGCNSFKGVKHEMKSVLKGKESVRIGVTEHCPSDVVTMNTQRSMKRMNSGTWMMMAENIVESGEVTQTFQKYSLKDITIGDRVGIIRLPEYNGSLVVYVNGAPLGVIAMNVAENLYGFVEMQGDCEKICISQNRTVQQEALPMEIRALREKEVELKHMKKVLEERDELILTLQGQMEMLRKQVIMMKSTHMMRRQNSSKMEITQDTETQTSSPTTLANGRCHSTSSHSSSRGSRKRRRGCCIS